MWGGKLIVRSIKSARMNHKNLIVIIKKEITELVNSKSKERTYKNYKHYVSEFVNE